MLDAQMLCRYESDLARMLDWEFHDLRCSHIAITRATWPHHTAVACTCPRLNCNSNRGVKHASKTGRTSLLPRIVTVVGACPSGWSAVNQRCFKYDAGKRNYWSSLGYCKSQGGNIASIHNDAENDIVINLAKEVAFLGAQSDGKGNWKWDDRTAWWQPASDKHDGLEGVDETKIAISNVDKKWHDWGKGFDKLGVVCSKDAEPGIDCNLARLFTHRNS